MKRILLFTALGLLAVVGILVAAGFYLMRDTTTPVPVAQGTVTSKDGTTIAFERCGSGPHVILVGAALADRDGAGRLARSLAPNFTVVNYDRRGRGKSTDTAPYTRDREVEDIEAVLDATGTPACLFGSSSGAVLALDAATRLGPKVKAAFLYEPPFIVDGSHSPIPADFAQQVRELAAKGQRNDAVTLFFTQGMGIPPAFVTMMRWLMPGWSTMTTLAHTIPYDLAILEGTQSGQPLPDARWAAEQAPVLVMVGSRSEPFFHSGAKALGDLLPHAQYRTLEGSDHSAILMAPQKLAAEANTFFTAAN
jgi:pimeloyl-ACP methyl ester carboxylesterase